MGEHTTFVGLDVHKATIAVCVAEAGRDGGGRVLGEIPNEPAALDKLAARLSRGGRTPRFVHEAGPCGYGAYRHLRDRGHDCVVVAPSLIPRKPGERIKTDRRDATALARLHRAGELTPVWVPDPEHEAMRDLVRARAELRRQALDLAAPGMAAGPDLPAPRPAGRLPGIPRRGQ